MIMVSILIPLYNSEKYIAETINSALNQSYKYIEIIVVDDGSTDNSYKIAKSFESEKLKVFQQTNKGASAARNIAFKKSSGDLIQYLDADDILEPNKIKLQVEEYVMFNNPNIIMSGKWGRFEKDIRFVKWENSGINKNYKSPINWLIDSWNGKGMAQPGIWLTSRSIIEKAGNWNESLSLNDDGEFFCRVLLAASEIKYVGNSKTYYRSNIETSLSKTKSHKAAQSELLSYQLYVKHCLRIKQSVRLKKALANNFLNFIYLYFGIHKELVDIAEKNFWELNIGKMWPVGGKKFKKFAKLFGLKNTLYIKSIIYNYAK